MRGVEEGHVKIEGYRGGGGVVRSPCVEIEWYGGFLPLLHRNRGGERCLRGRPSLGIVNEWNWGGGGVLLLASKSRGSKVEEWSSLLLASNLRWMGWKRVNPPPGIEFEGNGGVEGSAGGGGVFPPPCIEIEGYGGA